MSEGNEARPIVASAVGPFARHWGDAVVLTTLAFTERLMRTPLAQWVKQWLVGKTSHYLPVVARGAVPSIYRRAAFPHRATPVSLPLHMSTVWIHVV